MNVPLWLALFLKKRHKCRLVPPPWMDPSALDMKLQEERAIPSLSLMDFHYIEIAGLILASAREDIPHKTQVRKAIEDLFTLRMSKLKCGLKGLEATSRAINLTNAGAMELQSLRSMLTELMGGLSLLRAN